MTYISPLSPTRFGAATAPAAPEADAGADMKGIDHRLAAAMRHYEMELEACQEAAKSRNNNLNSYKKAQSLMGLGSMALAATMFTLFGDVTGSGLLAYMSNGAVRLFLGGIVPAGLLMFPMAKRVLDGSEKVNKYFA